MGDAEEDEVTDEDDLDVFLQHTVDAGGVSIVCGSRRPRTLRL